MSRLISPGSPLSSLKDLIRRREEKLKSSTAENSSYFFYMETLSSDINLLKGISASDTKMKALKPVSSCNLRLGNPHEFQPPLSLSSLEMSDSSRRSGGSFPVVGKGGEALIL